MKDAAQYLQQLDAKGINELQQKGSLIINLHGVEVQVLREDVEILTDDIPGWLVATEGAYTVALDVQLDENLIQEGLARELVNKIQNLRKLSGMEVTDRIDIQIQHHPALQSAIERNKTYICAETLGNKLELINNQAISGSQRVELSEEISTEIAISKSNIL
jgi:isoleucyl-tRNA synthetase